MNRKHQKLSPDNRVPAPSKYPHNIISLHLQAAHLLNLRQCPLLALLLLITSSCVTSFDVKPASDTETAYLSDSESDSDTEKHTDETEDSGSSEELDTDTVEGSDIDDCPDDPDKVEGEICDVDLVGAYHRLPIANNWHMGNIQETETGYLWVNAAGRSWVLVPDLDNDRLLTQADCPYHDSTGGDAFTLVLNGNTVTGFYFLEELYTRQD